MRKWFASDCSECGRPNGWWEDVAEGPITLEAYEDAKELEKINTLLVALWKPPASSESSIPIKYGYGKINISNNASFRLQEE